MKIDLQTSEPEIQLSDPFRLALLARAERFRRLAIGMQRSAEEIARESEALQKSLKS